jgi:hypothetical protein
MGKGEGVGEAGKQDCFPLSQNFIYTAMCLPPITQIQI